jgi:two-component system cell cycle sensor histidine kinase/response regulator CckA
VEEMLVSKAVFDQISDALIVRDLEDRIRFWNKGAENIYGWRADEVTGQNFYGVLSAGDLESLQLQTDQLVSTGEWTGELRQLTKTHKTIVVDSRWKIQKDESGQPVSVLMINKDITEKKILESEILRAQRIEIVSRLAASVVHDLNTVLSTMRISMDKLLREHTELADQYGLESWQFSSKHAAQLITQLLSLAKDIDDEPRSINVGRLIQETVRVLKGTFPPSIKIETTIPGDLYFVRGNATHLYQVVLNLCLNARDAMPSGGTLEIGAAKIVLNSASDTSIPKMMPGAYILIHVADTGVGIPAEITEHIFDPFFTTKDDDKGTGLGLFSAARIIKNHSGFINLDTQRKVGTQFMVYLPAENECRT